MEISFGQSETSETNDGGGGPGVWFVRSAGWTARHHNVSARVFFFFFFISGPSYSGDGG